MYVDSPPSGLNLSSEEHEPAGPDLFREFAPLIRAGIISAEEVEETFDAYREACGDDAEAVIADHVQNMGPAAPVAIACLARRLRDNPAGAAGVPPHDPLVTLAAVQFNAARKQRMVATEKRRLAALPTGERRRKLADANRRVDAVLADLSPETRRGILAARRRVEHQIERLASRLHATAPTPIVFCRRFTRREGRPGHGATAVARAPDQPRGGEDDDPAPPRRCSS
jgi:hypothetical protein